MHRLRHRPATALLGAHSKYPVLPAALISETCRPARLVLGTLVLALASAPAAAQTDYYNTDAGRPISVEDAYAIERRALEIQIAPFRLERTRGGIYTWGIEPEIAVGLFPRTQVEVGFPLAYTDFGAAQHSAGLAGIDVSVLHNLNVETSIPALAVAAQLLIPVGSLAPDRAYPSMKGIMTKTFRWARFHVNGQYTLGDRLPSASVAGGSGGVEEISQWMGGLAVDRTFPLESFLLTAELVARQPLTSGEKVAWSTAAGTRYQLSPRIATDAGAGIRLTGDDTGFFVTFGAAVALGLPWTPQR